MKLHWMPFAPSDYLADTLHLSTLHHGVYLLLICHYWQRGPIRRKHCYEIAKANDEQTKAAVSDVLAEFFVEDGDLYRHNRLDRELEKARNKHAARSAAGSKGGIAKKINSLSSPAASSNATSKTEAMLCHSLQPQSQPQSQSQEEVEEGNVEAGASTAPSVAPQVREVFAHWQKVHGHQNAKLGASKSKRYRAIAARLKEGYSVEQLCLAVDGCKNSPYHQGQNDNGTIYDDIELICRSAPHVDRFIRLSATQSLAGLSAAGRATAMAAQEWLEENRAAE